MKDDVVMRLETVRLLSIRCSCFLLIETGFRSASGLDKSLGPSGDGCVWIVTEVCRRPDGMDGIMFSRLRLCNATRRLSMGQAGECQMVGKGEGGRGVTVSYCVRCSRLDVYSFVNILRQS